MIEPTSQEELGYTDDEYLVYKIGFADGAIKILEKEKKAFKKIFYKS